MCESGVATSREIGHKEAQSSAESENKPAILDVANSLAIVVFITFIGKNNINKLTFGTYTGSKADKVRGLPFVLTESAATLNQ